MTQGKYGRGDWCVTLDHTVDASSAVVQAAVEYYTGSYGIAEWSTDSVGCSAYPNSVQIWTFGASGTVAPRSFTIVVA